MEEPMPGVKAVTFVALLAFATGSTGAFAGQYCHREWSPSRGDYLVCSDYPDPGHNERCRWVWSPGGGNQRICS